jgi:hypothetical protein
MSFNLKVWDGVTNEFFIGEVQYYFQLYLEDTCHSFAMLSKFTGPNQALLNLSSGALYSCQYLGKNNLAVCNVKSICSVVAMVKHPPIISEDLANGYEELEGFMPIMGNSYYLVEKLGLEVLHMTGQTEEIGD